MANSAVTDVMPDVGSQKQKLAEQDARTLVREIRWVAWLTYSFSHRFFWVWFWKKISLTYGCTRWLISCILILENSGITVPTLFFLNRGEQASCPERLESSRSETEVPPRSGVDNASTHTVIWQLTVNNSPFTAVWQLTVNYDLYTVVWQLTINDSLHTVVRQLTVNNSLYTVIWQLMVNYSLYTVIRRLTVNNSLYVVIRRLTVNNSPRTAVRLFALVGGHPLWVLGGR